MKKYKILAVTEICIIVILAIMLSMLCFNRKEALNNNAAENIYDSFTKTEIEQMRYSKLAWFSLTTDFDASQHSNVKVGDEFTVEYKLTNMTDRKLKVNIMSGQDSYEQVASLASNENTNPVATGDIHEYTFEPHESIVLTSLIKVDPNDSVSGGAYTLCASVLIEVLNEDLPDCLNNCYFDITMNDMYLYAE